MIVEGEDMLIKSALRKKIPSEQKWNGNKIHFEPDSSPMAWEYYKSVYGGKFMGYKINCPEYFNNVFSDNQQVRKEFEDKGIKSGCCDGSVWKNYVMLNINKNNRLYALKDEELKGCECNNIEFYEAIGRLSGDTDFNFKKVKFLEYSSLLFNGCKNKEEFLKSMSKLYECYEMHHTLLNFSLMQTMGNLQHFKSMGLYGDKLDRLDSFVFYLNYYYGTDNKETSKLVKYLNENVHEENKRILLEYLDSFGDIDKYCSNVYFAGVSNEETKKIRKKLVKQGKVNINSAERVIEYMELANEFWNFKEKCYNIRKGEVYGESNARNNNS